MTTFLRLPGDRDRGEIILGWLTKVAIVLVVIGIIAFDGISSAVLRMQVKDAAQNSAKAAVNDSTTALPSQQMAFQRADARLKEQHPDWTIDPASVIVMSDGSVTVTVTGEARTLVAGRISQLDNWTSAQATETARRSL